MIINHNCCIKLVPLVIFIYDALSHIHQILFGVLVLCIRTIDQTIVIFWNYYVSLYQVHLTIHRALYFVLVISQTGPRILTGIFLYNIASLSSDDWVIRVVYIPQPQLNTSRFNALYICSLSFVCANRGFVILVRTFKFFLFSLVSSVRGRAVA